MVAEYKSKWEKFQAAKWQATDGQKSVREMERVMDVELFLGLQERWAEDSPHCLVILYEIFGHVAAEGLEGSGTDHLPRPLAELASGEPGGRHTPPVQLVGPETTKELLEVYLEVFKMHRLPGSPPGEPAILEEVLSSLPNHQRCEEEEGPCSNGMTPC